MESIKQLQLSNQYLYEKFMQGHFVVKDNSVTFNCVAPDMKLEQTIQRVQKSSNGIIGKTRQCSYVASWQLVYHKVLAITIVFRDITNAKIMNRTESFHHDLTGRQG